MNIMTTNETLYYAILNIIDFDFRCNSEAITTPKEIRERMNEYLKACDCVCDVNIYYNDDDILVTNDLEKVVYNGSMYVIEEDVIDIFVTKI